MTKFNHVFLKDIYGWGVENTIAGEQRTVTPVKLVGTNFIGATVDPNFITTSVANGGTVIQGKGQLILATNGANGAAYISSSKRARYVAGSSMRYRSVGQGDDVGAVGNKRRWGIADWVTMPNIIDGAYFQLDGTTLGVATLNDSNLTLVNSGAFNGDYGASLSLDTLAHTFEIYWSNKYVYFVIDDKVLHKVSALTGAWTSTVTLYAWGDNVNSGGHAVNHTMRIRVVSIHRLGSLQSAPRYVHISTATTTILKYGAGTLHKIVVNNPTNNAITVYDNTAGSGAIIAIINPGASAVPVVLSYDCDFSTGLCIVTAGTPDLTVSYE